MKLVHSLKFIVFGLILIGLLVQLPSINATAGPCSGESDSAKAKASGLVTTAGTINNLTILGSSPRPCISEETKAAFISYKLPGYDDLKSIYFTQSKAGKKELTNAVLTSTQLDDQKVHFRDGNLDINATLAYSVTAVVFVNGYLSINQNITGSVGTGLVLVVRDNVNIQPTVTQIDAVIISQGTIYTAGASCTTNSVDVGASANALTVNGSLISLDSTKPIIFCRKLTDNSLLPAEKIHYEPKYLVILKDLFADTYQKWSEIQ